ncbi:MAG: lysophospholipid acyltransferase family protein [Alistipes sp.]|nr:lysophospholipid acyltransferase family protein [Alistipes sp.]
MNDVKLNFLQRIALELLWGFSRFMHITPRWFRFGLFQPFIFVLFFVVRYRRRVVLQNLRHSFPEKSDKEIRRIMRKFYSFLAEIVVDTISLAGAEPSDKEQYIHWENGEEHRERMAGKNWIAMAAHFGCWEYFLLWTWFAKSQLVGVYHPLKSKVFECYYRRLRNFSPNVSQVPMKDTMRFFLRNRDNAAGMAIGLISDQSPLLYADTVWYDFLNRKTAFVEGGEKIALKFHLPVYFCYNKRIRAGEYSIRFDEIYDGVEEVAPNEITRRYVERLEAMIKEHPELWLWSHNRWKHTPEKQARRFGKSTLE